MKQITFAPFFKISSLGGAVAATKTKSIYLPSLDTSRKITATWIVSGTFGGATVKGKFYDSANDSTWAACTDGAFTDVTSATVAGGVSIEFMPATTTLTVNDMTGGNYKKYLCFEYNTTGGTGSNLTVTVNLSGIYIPDDVVTLKLYA